MSGVSKLHVLMGKMAFFVERNGLESWSHIGWDWDSLPQGCRDTEEVLRPGEGYLGAVRNLTLSLSMFLLHAKVLGLDYEICFRYKMHVNFKKSSSFEIKIWTPVSMALTTDLFPLI